MSDKELMEGNESNLISLMVEETMSSSSLAIVDYIEDRKCYQLQIYGYVFEIPLNWAGLEQSKPNTLQLPEELVLMLNSELARSFELIEIIKNNEAQYSLNIQHQEESGDQLAVAA